MSLNHPLVIEGGGACVCDPPKAGARQERFVRLIGIRVPRCLFPRSGKSSPRAKRV
jgi:hypothetical protein